MKPWVKTGIIIAVFLFVTMTFVYPYILPLFGFEQEPEKYPVVRMVINAVASIVTGLWIGYSNRNNKKVKKQIDS